MQINFQRLSVGFVRVGGEGGTETLLSYGGIVAQSSFVPFSSAVYIVMHNKSYTNFILLTSHTVLGGGHCAKTESLQEKTEIISFFGIECKTQIGFTEI
jgi:hypothetical protein